MDKCNCGSNEQVKKEYTITTKGVTVTSDRMFCATCGELKHNYLLDEEFKKKLDSKKKFIKEKNKRLGKKLSDSIKEKLIYIGFVTAIISIIGYIAVTIVMIKGFTSEFELKNQILFSLVGVGIGLVITFSLRYQGVAFAKDEPESKKTMRLYYNTLNKNKKMKKLHTITYYLVKKFIFDVVIKGVILVITTVFVIDIFSKGNGDWSLIGLMIFNILIFTGFGLMAIAGAYDYYIEQHIPVIVERTRKLNVQSKEPLPPGEYIEVIAKRDLKAGEVVSKDDYIIPFIDLREDYSEGK